MQESPLERYQRTFPEGAAEVMHHLWQSVNALNYEWGCCHTMFMNSPETVEVLNKWSGQFFSCCRELLRRDVLLGIARMLDPGKIGRQENVSFRGLADALERDYADLAKEIHSKAERLNKTAAPIRKARNKILAHSDKKVVSQGMGNLPGISWEDVRRVLDDMCELLNVVDQCVGDTTTMFEFSRDDGLNEIMVPKLRDAVGAMYGRGDAEMEAS